MFIYLGTMFHFCNRRLNVRTTANRSANKKETHTAAKKKRCRSSAGSTNSLNPYVLYHALQVLSADKMLTNAHPFTLEDSAREEALELSVDKQCGDAYSK